VEDVGNRVESLFIPSKDTKARLILLKLLPSSESIAETKRIVKGGSRCLNPPTGGFEHEVTNFNKALFSFDDISSKICQNCRTFLILLYRPNNYIQTSYHSNGRMLIKITAFILGMTSQILNFKVTSFT
jgi:hypothetical protein